MPVRIEVSGEVVTAYLSGELDHHAAREIREEIDKAVDLNMPTMLVLDFGDISFMDSSGIGLVMGRYRKLQQNKAELHVVNTTPHIYKVMKLAGLEKLAKIDKGGNIGENSK